MNSQQELIDAINTISQSKDKSFDTPATVLRVDGDTVWVHIDGGADETPVRKTINCEQGEMVQVRIANGSAFLVGNESAPPTDDKTANVAHFVAVEADAKATDAINTANAIVQTVSGKVDSGSSNVTTLSSTMYQNANGVNIYNDTLAVGDSYAHIDGNSFDIKETTTAGTIDDANDTIIASFGATSYIQSEDANIIGRYHKINFASDSIEISTEDTLTPYTIQGWKFDGEKIERYGDIYSGVLAGINADTGNIYIQDANLAMGGGGAYMDTGGQARFFFDDGGYGVVSGYTDINKNVVSVVDDTDTVYSPDETDFASSQTIIDGGNVRMTGDVYDYWGAKKTPTVLTSTTISAATTSYTFLNSAIKSDSVIDIYDDIFGFSPTGITVTTGSAVITFQAQASTHKIKLFVY